MAANALAVTSEMVTAKLASQNEHNLKTKTTTDEAGVQRTNEKKKHTHNAVCGFLGWPSIFDEDTRMLMQSTSNI